VGAASFTNEKLNKNGDEIIIQHLLQDVAGNVNQLFPMFGQFVCHDIILTAGQKAVADCCSAPGANVIKLFMAVID
jgi:hypothetical protein